MPTSMPPGRALRTLFASISTACALAACDDTTVVIASRTTPPEDSGGGGLTVIVSSGDRSAEAAEPVPLQPEPAPAPPVAAALALALTPEDSALPVPALGIAGQALAALMVAGGAACGIFRRARDDG